MPQAGILREANIGERFARLPPLLFQAAFRRLGQPENGRRLLVFRQPEKAARLPYQGGVCAQKTFKNKTVFYFIALI
ncbi:MULTISPECIES: hypothetical protein [Eikenella]|uniref:hypothetical protein n=1 Tax=Eikenella TaxID=538 RepID=UPI0012E970A7|nr:MULTISPECIES: hypothetical protein [Eikenella]